MKQKEILDLIEKSKKTENKIKKNISETIDDVSSLPEALHCFDIYKAAVLTFGEMILDSGEATKLLSDYVENITKFLRQETEKFNEKIKLLSKTIKQEEDNKDKIIH